jgi:hypothetical protein
MLPKRGVTGTSELPKRLTDQKDWKRLHDALTVESDCLSPAQWQRRYNQVMALGNCRSTTQTQEHLATQLVASPEDSRVTPQLSKMSLVKMLIRMNYTEMPSQKLMLTPLRKSQIIELKLTPLGLSLMITSRPDLMVKLRTGSIYTRGFRIRVVRMFRMMGVLVLGALVTVALVTVMNAMMGCLSRRMMDTLTTVIRRTLFTTTMGRTSITNSSSRRPLASIPRHPFRRYILHSDTSVPYTQLATVYFVVAGLP